MRVGVRIFLVAAVLAGSLLASASASAITSAELNKVPLRDDLQRSEAPSSFCASGAKWSLPTILGESAASCGGAYNSGGRLGYGSPSGWAAAYWNTQEFKDNGSGIAVEATLTGPMPSGQAVGLWLMPNPTTVKSGYELYITGGGTGTAYLYKWTNGTPELLRSAAAITNNISYALVEKNGQVSAWGKTTGSWANPSPFLVADSTYNSGYAVLQVNGTGPSLDNFSAGALPPSMPTPASSSPASPNSSTTPSILGTAEPETTVRLYTNSSCSGEPAASGSAANFKTPGIGVSVAEESTTTFYASASNADGVSSPCSSSSVTYKSTGLIAEGGFEEGTLNHWNYSGSNDAAAPSVTNADARAGSYSADFKLTGTQERSELTFGGNGSTSSEGTFNFFEGDDRYYAFAFKIREMSYGKPGGHNLFMQFKSEGEGSPYFGLQLWDTGGNKGLYTGGEAQGGEHFLTTVSEKQWHDVVIHFVASAKGAGSYELYLDGTKIDSKTKVSMIVPGKEKAFIKNGIYRNPKTVSGTSEILIDNAKLGKTLASVGGLGGP